MSELTDFGVQRTPWINDGQSVDQVKTMTEAMEKANLDFTVETSPVMHKTGTLDIETLVKEQGYPQSHSELVAFCNASTSQQFSSVPSYNVIRREDTHNVFGTCGNRWEPLQNVDAFDWFQPALDANLVKLNTVGQLGGGKKIWILAELNKAPAQIVPNEEIAKYIILGNGHDGGTAIFVGFTPIRVWCANMFPQLRQNAATSLIRLNHTRNAKVQLDSLRDVMNYADAEFEATAEQYRELCRHTINNDDLEKYVKILLCNKVEVEQKLSELSTRKRNIVENVINLFDAGLGLQHKDVRGTYFAAFNAFNQYLNYEVGRSSNNRLNSLWFGKNRSMNEQALQLAVEMIAA